jgi:hypothetical protein
VQNESGHHANYSTSCGDATSGWVKHTVPAKLVDAKWQENQIYSFFASGIVIMDFIFTSVSLPLHYSTKRPNLSLLRISDILWNKSGIKELNE